MKELTFHDPADLPQASACDHPADHGVEAFCTRCNHEVDAVCPVHGTPVEPTGEESGAGLRLTPEVQWFLRRLFTTILQARNKTIVMHAYLFATGDAYADGLSMTDVSRQLGCTKAVISKHAVKWVREFGLDPSRYMLSKKAAQKFRESNRRPVKVA